MLGWYASVVSKATKVWLGACIDTHCVARKQTISCIEIGGEAAWFTPSAPSIHARRAHSRKVVARITSCNQHALPWSRDALGENVRESVAVMLAVICTSRAEARGSECPSTYMAPALLVGCGDDVRFVHRRWKERRLHDLPG